MRYLFILLNFLFLNGQCQENESNYTLDVNYYYGSFLPHSNKIKHLITDHPEGVFVSANKKTFGEEEWESRMDYPDYGLTLHYQNNKNESIGDMYGAFAHYNFYFFKRNLQMRVGQGIAYNDNPYDKEKNYRNLAYGSHFMPATFLMLNYQKENIWQGLGIRAGAFLIHHSNGTMKTPNTSMNTVGANVGIHYSFNSNTEREFIHPQSSDSFREPIKYNLAFRTGVHESHIIGSGQHPFYFISAYADKRFSRSSAFQLGFDLFLSLKAKHEIQMMAISFPEKGISADTDYKRVGVFAGYELFINNLSIEGQLGAYLHDEYKSHTFLYQHLALKYYIHNNLFISTGLKTHFSKAEAMDFAIGFRL